MKAASAFVGFVLVGFALFVGYLYGPTGSAPCWQALNLIAVKFVSIKY